MAPEKFEGENLTDPFKGGPIEIVQVANNLYWVGRGDGWATKMFDTRQELVHFLSTRGGKSPKFDATPWKEPLKAAKRDIEVTDAEQVILDRRERDEMVTESVNRIAHKPVVGARKSTR